MICPSAPVFASSRPPNRRHLGECVDKFGRVAAPGGGLSPRVAPPPPLSSPQKGPSVAQTALRGPASRVVGMSRQPRPRPFGVGRRRRRRCRAPGAPPGCASSPPRALNSCRGRAARCCYAAPAPRTKRQTVDGASNRECIDRRRAANASVRRDFANLARIRDGIARPEACFATGGVLAESEGPRRGANPPATAPLRLIRRRGVRESERGWCLHKCRVSLSLSHWESHRRLFSLSHWPSLGSWSSLQFLLFGRSKVCVY